MADPITYDDFAKLELRVAKVLEARPHPNADKLFCCRSTSATSRSRSSPASASITPPEQLVGKLIVVVNNLAPAMLRGETSNGMLLAATSGDKVVLLTPDDPQCVVGRRSNSQPSQFHANPRFSPRATPRNAMAFATINYHSRSLQKASSFNIVFPDDPKIPRPWSVYYLLHGLSDDHTIWMRRTSIERYVAGLPLVVVMPDGGRGWYTNAVEGYKPTKTTR